ncbi:Rad1/Rec1/Rad17 [Halteromyces radiatus]|uniref:Rad1/Rec1/Rad17 n=1 Tax=Halteromyces radiatus TaxID=101107 RepID=UPI002220BA6B|nr:Rad1/Rec1/Rad17 [Halteromyces radiatus]KAI8082739.1 Rad1/Rec1/Rad17 [Halteromyces radiatus]
MSQIEPFTANLKAVKLLLGMIKTIQFRPVATCDIQEEGLTFTVTEHQSIKAVVYAKRIMFEQYRLGTIDRSSFDLHLVTLVDCLGVVCPSGMMEGCKMKYNGIGTPLELTREDNHTHLTHTCKIKTMEPELDTIDLSVNDREIVQTVIMKASLLQDALGDLDSSCEQITIKFFSQDLHFQLFGTGTNGTTSMTDYHADNAEPFIAFDFSCDGTYKYLYSHIARCTKALDQASDVTMKISVEGFLSLLFKIGTSVNDDAAYVEFTFIPCVE